jgi:peptidoglycan/LPS O-acetylase OafA/YrhL
VGALGQSLYRGLSRVTSGGKFIPEIDGLRCIAIMAVLLYHFEDQLVHKHPEWDQAVVRSSLVHRVLQTGGVGVPLFFAISGFVLGLPFIAARQGLRPAVSLGRYFRRRVTRLEPPYIINLLLLTALLIVVRGDDWRELAPHLGASLIYLHGPIYESMSRINFVTWSLEVEVQFYLLAPWIAAVVYGGSITPRRGVTVLAILCWMAWKFAGGPPPDSVWRFTLAAALDHFLVGMLLADIYVTDWKQQPARSLLWDGVAVVGWSCLLGTQLWSPARVLLPAATFLALWGSLQGRVSRAVLAWPVATVIGGMCYTIYLYHFTILTAVNRGLEWGLPATSYHTTVWGHLLVQLPLVLAVSAGLFWLFEKPFMAWRGTGLPAWTWSVAAPGKRPRA